VGSDLGSAVNEKVMAMPRGGIGYGSAHVKLYIKAKAVRHRFVVDSAERVDEMELVNM
jgi:hypothetical protein